MKHRIHLSLILLLLSASAFAQEITVKDFGQAAQFIASGDQIRDWDNELCALVKIQGAKIDSISGAFEVRNMGSEMWVYMTNGDRKLTIYMDGYEPKDVVFREFGIDGVQSNKVYLMVIYAKQKQRLFVGLHAGGNFSTNRDLGAGYGSAKSIAGFIGGVSASYMFSDLLGASAGMYFATKGYKYSDVNIDDEKGNFQFLDIPVQALLNLNLAKSVALQVLAGPCFSVNLGGKVKAKFPWTDDKFADRYSAFQLGGQAALRLVFAKHYAIGADYQIGFGNYNGQSFGFNIGYIF